MTVIAIISQLRQSIILDGKDSDAVPSSVPLLGPSSSSSLTPSDIALIRDRTDALEKESVDVEQNIHFLESLLSRFHRRRDQNRTTILFQKSLLVPLPLPSPKEIVSLSDKTSRVPYFSAPISLLPVEIIVEILQIATRDLSRKSIRDTLDTKRSAPWTFSRVCRVWRAIVASTPMLWTRIDILGDEGSNHFPKAKLRPLRKYLHRSSHNLLDIMMELSDIDNLARPLKSLIRHTHRWSIVELTITPYRFQTMASLVGAADFPELKRLDIDVRDAFVIPTALSADRRREVITQPIEVFRNAHNLEEVSLQGINLSQILLPLRQLKRFSGEIQDMTELRDLFRDAPDLHQATLQISFQLRWSNAAHLQTLSHAKLRWLSIHTWLECLKHLHLPALQHLQTVDLFSFDHHILDTVDFLSNSQCRLRTLFLPDLPIGHVIAILTTCPSTLTALSLHVRAKDASRFYQKLRYKGSASSCLAPRLKHLYIHDDFYAPGVQPSYHSVPSPLTSHNGLLNLVASRRSQDAKSNGIALLRSLTLCIPYTFGIQDPLILSLNDFEGLSVKFYGFSMTKRMPNPPDSC
ncbi:hypothetical protein ARMSODRAFT_962618 [Armillaria solidipes]|uniref:Uncharacterized protein n=1 Tax=Armillaria solidipes TaxID=1076256 RepID=A0A2H3BJ44_9AGAR|nr:hypothetical protein ARMSODRAFT_962618 [Armillaria solidipes]